MIHGRLTTRARPDIIVDAAAVRSAISHIGQQATVVYFAAKLLGRDARLYDGSWDEWSRRSGLPIETGMGNRHE